MLRITERQASSLENKCMSWKVGWEGKIHPLLQTEKSMWHTVWQCDTVCDSVTPLVTPRFSNHFIFSILRTSSSSWSSIPPMVYHGAVFFRHISMKQHKLELMTLFDNWNLEWADDLTSQLLVYQFIVTYVPKIVVRFKLCSRNFSHRIISK